MAIPTVNNFIRQKVIINSVTNVADGVKEISFQRPDGISVIPGQFVGVAINDGQAEPGFRAYSALSDVHGNMQICVKKVENGRGSTFLHTLKGGEEMDVILPLGYFSFPLKLSQHLLFIATGTGIVPILALLESLPDGFKGTATLIFGVRNEKDLFYEERIRKVTASNPNFSATITLSQPSPVWKGSVGRVTSVIEKMELEGDTQSFICGNGSMITSARAMLKAKGLKARNIFYEDFND